MCTLLWLSFLKGLQVVKGKEEGGREISLRISRSALRFRRYSGMLGIKKDPLLPTKEIKQTPNLLK